MGDRQFVGACAFSGWSCALSVLARSVAVCGRPLDGYPREAFLADLVREAAADIRGALDKGAHSVQIDFTEGGLAVKLDPSGQLLRSFADLNNQVLGQFSDNDRSRIGVHTCPGGDQDSTHSADVDYVDLLPSWPGPASRPVSSVFRTSRRPRARSRGLRASEYLSSVRLSISSLACPALLAAPWR